MRMVTEVLSRAQDLTTGDIVRIANSYDWHTVVNVESAAFDGMVRLTVSRPTTSNKDGLPTVTTIVVSGINLHLVQAHLTD